MSGTIPPPPTKPVPDPKPEPAPEPEPAPGSVPGGDWEIKPDPKSVS